MRKTKLIILPTKCLNQVGFLLLFLSCPVIGDWGRIRPDTEMSQWSILIEREGSCGLVRNPPEIKNGLTPGGRTENQDTGRQNNTLMLTEDRGNEKFGSEIPSNRIQAESERRITLARRDVPGRIQARQAREGRRAVSLERSTFRHIENSRRNERFTPQREIRLDGRRNDVGRLSVDRGTRRSSDRIRDNAERRLVASRREREIVQGGPRRADDVPKPERITESRRTQERRLAGRLDADKARRSIEMRRVSERRSSSRRTGDARIENSQRREYDEERRVAGTERRSLDRRADREVSENRRRDNVEERRLSETRRARSEERRIRTSDARRMTRNTDRSIERARNEPEVRTARVNAVTDRSDRIAAESRRRSDIRRSERSVERREAPLPGESRTAGHVSRKQEIRMSVRRVDKIQDIGAYRRENMERTNRYSGIESLTFKQKKLQDVEESRWEFLDGLKNWFSRKNDRESWTANNDFATTCLVGAAVYFLTTRHIKTV